MKIMTIVGARPEFIQLAPISKAVRRRHQEILVHTGQHYDDNMSRVFFDDLGIVPPEFHLGVGGGGHGAQTGRMLIKLEETMLQEKPDWVLVFGDTNSTVSGALAAAKLWIPIAHVEAGLRSFDRRMPEEVNRVIVDHMSQMLLAPTQTGVDNLKNEGITEGVEMVGDVRVDVMHDFLPKARERRQKLLTQAGVAEGEAFALATIHRPSNTDDRARLAAVLEAFRIAGLPIVLPVHPRLKKMMDAFEFRFSDNVRALEPLGFLELLSLLDACQIVITDSGGLQKESYMLRRPTVTVRDTTEWIETVHSGWNRLSEPEPAEFRAAIAAARAEPPAEHPDFYGSVGVCERIVDLLEAHESSARAPG